MKCHGTNGPGTLSVGGLGVVPAVRAAPASMQRASGRGGEGRGWIARRG
jgi:hypothetical protein